MLTATLRLLVVLFACSSCHAYAKHSGLKQPPRGGRRPKTTAKIVDIFVSTKADEETTRKAVQSETRAPVLEDLFSSTVTEATTTSAAAVMSTAVMSTAAISTATTDHSHNFTTTESHIQTAAITTTTSTQTPQSTAEVTSTSAIVTTTTKEASVTQFGFDIGVQLSTIRSEDEVGAEKTALANVFNDYFQLQTEYVPGIDFVSSVRLGSDNKAAAKKGQHQNPSSQVSIVCSVTAVSKSVAKNVRKFAIRLKKDTSGIVPGFRRVLGDISLTATVTRVSAVKKLNSGNNGNSQSLPLWMVGVIILASLTFVTCVLSCVYIVERKQRLYYMQTQANEDEIELETGEYMESGAVMSPRRRRRAAYVARYADAGADDAHAEASALVQNEEARHSQFNI